MNGKYHNFSVVIQLWIHTISLVLRAHSEFDSAFKRYVWIIFLISPEHLKMRQWHLASLVPAEWQHGHLKRKHCSTVLAQSNSRKCQKLMWFRHVEWKYFWEFCLTGCRRWCSEHFKRESLHHQRNLKICKKKQNTNDNSQGAIVNMHKADQS